MGVSLDRNNHLIEDILEHYPIPEVRPVVVETKEKFPNAFSHNILLINQSTTNRGDPALNLAISLWMVSVIFLPSLLDTTFMLILMLVILFVYCPLIAVFENSRIGKFFQSLLWLTLLIPPIYDQLTNGWGIDQFIVIYMAYLGLIIIINSPLLNPLRRRYFWGYTPKFNLTTPLLRYDNLDPDELAEVLGWMENNNALLSQFLKDTSWSMNPKVVRHVEYLQQLYPIISQFWQNWSDEISLLSKKTRPYGLLQQINLLRLHSPEDPLHFDVKLGLRIVDFNQIAVHEIDEIVDNGFDPSDYYYVDLTIRGDSVNLQTMELIQQSMADILDRFFTYAHSDRSSPKL